MRIRQLLYNTRSSFWFVPGLIVLGGIVAAFVMVEIDGLMSDDWLANWPTLFAAGADGSRGLLAAIASSMMTVAGVVFSITLVAFSLTSSQYSSRVLRNFMRDSVNQSVLGVFLGIYAYCLIVLRTIYKNDDVIFVPQLAVMGGLLLGFVGIGYLIFFIHHIAVSIQASQILAEVARETKQMIDHVFPEQLPLTQEPETQRVPEQFGKHREPVIAEKGGFLQSTDTSALLKFANEHDYVIEMVYELGEFVIQNTPVAYVLTVERLPDQAREYINKHFTVGRERTFEQDVAYGLRQLVDLALKALSPGINDTTTAIMAVDYLTALLVQLANRKIESCFRDQNDEVRIVTTGPSFERLLDLGFSQIRRESAGNVAVLAHLIGSLRKIELVIQSPSRKASVDQQLAALRELIDRTVPAPQDHKLLTEQLVCD